MLVLLDVSPTFRRAELRHLAGRALRRPAEAIDVLHREGRGPVLMSERPAALQRRPSLSSASRGRFSVVAMAPVAIGVDVEIVEADTPIPWGVLHPAEVDALERLAPDERPARFAQMWSVKEAYLKALRIGLAREPRTLEVTLRWSNGALVEDPGSQARVATVETIWRQAGWDTAALSVVLLDE